MNKQFYCYTHATPYGDVFYVGKGHGKRAWNFKGRNDDHKAIVAEFGSENTVIDILPADSEEDALRMERFLITVIFGRAPLVNKTCGGEGVEKGQSVSERQAAFVQRQKAGMNGKAPQKKLLVWVPVQTFERFNQLAEKEGRTNTFVRLVEGVPQ